VSILVVVLVMGTVVAALRGGKPSQTPRSPDQRHDQDARVS